MSLTMRLLGAAAVLASLTSAQMGNLPSCATECVTEFTSGSAIGGCNNIDVVCICENKNFLSGIACCLEGKCDEADQEQATNYAIGFCKLSGVTDLPTAVSQICTSTVSSSATSSSGVAITSMTSSASSAESSASSAVSSASQSVTSAVSSMSSAASSVAASLSSQASSSTSSAAASATKNAGPQNVAGLGAGIIGGLAAAVALL